MASVINKGVKSILPPLMHSQKVGVVVSAGKMAGAVKVRVAEVEWNKKFRKNFPAPKTYLARDPNTSLVLGDVVRITSGYRTSKAINHVVTAIVAPFGEPVENRPPVLSVPELDAKRVEERLLKDVRSAEKGRAVSRQRLEVARKQGLRIPTLEEAMAGARTTEEEMRGRVRKEAHKGQAGQGMTAKQRRTEQGKKTKAEVKAEEMAKEARRQTSKA